MEEQLSHREKLIWEKDKLWGRTIVRNSDIKMGGGEGKDRERGEIERKRVKEIERERKRESKWERGRDREYVLDSR